MRTWLYHALAGMFRLAGRNTITLVGASLTTVSAALIISLLILGYLGLYDTPYIGILVFLALPGLFVVGLLLIPIGVLWDRRLGRPDPDTSGFPVIDFNKTTVQRTAVLMLVLTFANVLILGVVSYEGVHYMESTQFCGQVCHVVMEPEHAAYVRSPHSRVDCVDCHIGPGAPWFVRSKLSGVRQVFAVALDTYAKPIHTPVHNLRPSRDTCEQCHWPQKFTGDRVRVIERYQPDEQNTKLTTVLLMHIGGANAATEGIHSWHIADGRKTTYLALDGERQEIAWVQVEEPDGTTRFVHPDFDPAAPLPKEAEVREMDCIDCHNRPTHRFELPGPAVDEALASGRIAADLPYVKKLGVEVLAETEGPDKDQALERIASRVAEFYATEYPEIAAGRAADVAAATETLQAIYGRNIFPQMDIRWGTYENHLGHQEFPGCFRCHTSEHANDEGATIPQDCFLCHAMPAWDEEDPEILAQLPFR